MVITACTHKNLTQILKIIVYSKLEWEFLGHKKGRKTLAVFRPLHLPMKNSL